MIFSTSVAVLFVALLAAVAAHGDAWLRNVRTVSAEHCGPDSVFFYSYHVHVLFEQHVPARVAAAAALLRRFQAAFAGAATACNETATGNTTYPVSDVCFLEWDVPPARPFPVAEWAVFVPPAHWAAVAAWVMRHRGSLDVLLHPNSGCEVADHTEFPLWAGHRWPLDVTALHYDCPACTYDACLKKTATVFAPIAAAQATCGLDALFRPRAAAQFCSPQCVMWVQSLLAVARDCPNFCDTGNWTSCSTVQAALPMLQKQEPRCGPL